MKTRLPANRIRYTQVPNGIVTFGFAFSSIFHPLLIRTPSFFAEGKEDARLIINYLPILPRKAIAIMSRSRGQRDQSAPLFFLPRLLPSAPLYGDLFRTCTRMKNNARIGEVCHQAAGTLHIREAEHTWAPRGAQHPEAERTGAAGRPVREMRRYD